MGTEAANASPALVVYTRGTPGCDMRIFTMKPDGTLQAQAKRAPVLGGRPIVVTAGDFSGDGKRSLAALYGGNQAEVQVRVFDSVDENILEAAKGWTIPRSAFDEEQAFSCVSADFNGDGRDDLAIGFTRGVRVFLSDGKSFLDPLLVSVPNAKADTLLVGDVNGDQLPDLLVPTRDGGISVVRSN